MCGICGIAIPKKLNRRVDPAKLLRMRDTMTHRGPDGAGIWPDGADLSGSMSSSAYADGSVGLGHRRLAIVDVDGGHQPMSNEDSSVWITFNGEIYNHRSLRPALEESGHQYNSECDTETIIHLYEEYGAEGVARLGGMFAFGIWDARQRQLLLARDRLGIKPLYYVLTDDGTLYFASEIKALLAARAVTPELNYNALPDYLANYATSGEETLFRGVKRLLPGHTLLWRDGQIRIEQYWDVRFASNGHDTHNGNGRHRSENDYIEEWGQAFRGAVRSHLMADVPLGMFLSGGIDSSAIAAVMSQMVSEPIKTFSVAFAEREANELEYAQIVARAYGTQHHEVIVSPEEYFAAMPKLIWHEDEPLAHSASVPLYFVSQLAARHVKVVLTGEGSDELLGGYYRYRRTMLNLAMGQRYHQWTNETMRGLIRRGIGSLPESSKPRRLASRTFLCLPPDIESLYLNNFAVYPSAMQQTLLTTNASERAHSLDPYIDARGYLARTDADSPLNRLLYLDLKTCLHELLMKQDQMSMAASLESRVPFLDNDLVDLTSQLPERFKLRGWTTKYILRRSMQGLLPDVILKRPKMGFPVPIGAWFRGRYRSMLDEYLLSERAINRGLFDPQYVERLVAQHQAGVGNHAQRLWALVNLEMWQRQFIDGEAAEGTVPGPAKVVTMTA